MRAKIWLAVAAAFLLLACALPASVLASPHGGGGMRVGRGEMHRGFHRVVPSQRVYVEPYYGFGWGLNLGWGNPWIWDPYYYPGPSVMEVRHANYGTLEFKVKPEDTKVYVDKKFIGTVNELDHKKAYVAAGNHEIKLEAPDGQSMERNLYVAAGKKIKIKETF